MSSMYPYVIISALAMIYIVYFAISGRQRFNQLQRYTRVYLGMSTDEMLQIMGPNYEVSSLRNDRQKYTWKYRVTANTMSVSIYTKNGVVEEIRPNL